MPELKLTEAARAAAVDREEMFLNAINARVDLLDDPHGHDAFASAVERGVRKAREICCVKIFNAWVHIAAHFAASPEPPAGWGSMLDVLQQLRRPHIDMLTFGNNPREYVRQHAPERFRDIFGNAPAECTRTLAEHLATCLPRIDARAIYRDLESLSLVRKLDFNQTVNPSRGFLTPHGDILAEAIMEPALPELQAA